MNNHTQQRKWLLIPFYDNPASVSHEENVRRFVDFISNTRQVIDFNIAVVDDGSGLSQDRFDGKVDLLVQMPENRGKAQAVREGIRTLINDPDVMPDFIVQYDGDGDQSFRDIPLLMDNLISISEGDPTRSTLIIGDRYSKGLLTSPNPDSISYRQSVLILFGAISRQFGYDVRDWVSGARGYTREYASRFLGRSRSDNYGIEAEQLAISYLEGATVRKVPLTDSRRRDPHTDTSKWLQNFDALLAYKDELREKGQDVLVDTLENLTQNLRNGNDTFELDLNPLGEDTRMKFERHGITHSAEIPAGYRSEIFSENGHPFALRKER
ncbi:MAG: hypothetical protein AAB521_04875 [Patescibacteria group bacterium]